MAMSTILVIDDDPMLRRHVRHLLSRMGHEVIEAPDGREGLALAAAQPIDLVITDLRMPEVDGLGVLEGLRHAVPAIPALVLTSSGRVADAVAAMKAGAVEFLCKPVQENELHAAVDAALGVGSGDDQAGERLRRAGGAVVGESAAMSALLDQVEQVGPSNATALITGETGTGKEVVARLLHAASPRSGGPLIVVNCGAIPDGLVESELFGHARGAFTGAVARRTGAFVSAHHGSLFLDEIGELPRSAQAKLLRALQEREVVPVGESVPIGFDTRVIAATHRDLEAMVAEGTFREDLYYRLAVVPLQVPALRDRTDDLPLLVRHLLDAACARNRRSVTIAPAVLEVLSRYRFPGNVRELENLVERLVIIDRDGVIEVGDLPDKIRRAEPPLGDAPAVTSSGGTLNEVLRETEARMIADAIRQAEGNKTLAAQILGVNRTTLVAKLKRR
jgi:DNA-binding NtrC family response regulator